MSNQLNLKDALNALQYTNPPQEQSQITPDVPKLYGANVVMDSSSVVRQPKGKRQKKVEPAVTSPVVEETQEAEIKFDLQSIFKPEFLAQLTGDDLNLTLSQIIIKHSIAPEPELESINWTDAEGGEIWDELNFSTPEQVTQFMSASFELVESFYPTGPLSLEVYIEPENKEANAEPVSQLYGQIKAGVYSNPKPDVTLSDVQQTVVCSSENNLIQKLEVEKNFLIKVPIAKIGQWKHPLYGEVKFTSDDLDIILSNFRQNVLGFEVPIYFGHSTGDGKPSQGSLVHIERLEDILFGYWKVNKKTYRMVEDGDFRYSSSEIILDMTSKSTGHKLGKTLYGMALTNIPFVPDLPKNIALEDANIKNNVIYMSFDKEDKTKNEYSNSNTLKMDKNELSAVEQALKNQVEAYATKVKELETKQLELSNTQTAEEITKLKAEVEKYSQKESAYSESEQKLATVLEQNKKLADMVEGYQSDIRKQAVEHAVDKLNKLSLPQDFKNVYVDLVKEGKLGDSEEVILNSIYSLGESFTTTVTEQAGSTEATAQLDNEKFEDPYAKETARVQKLIDAKREAAAIV